MRKMSEIQNDFCFQVDILDMSARMDAEFYRPSFANNEILVSKKAGHRTLSDYVLSMNGGATPRLSDSSAYDLTDGAVPFIRVQNLTKYGELNLNSYKEISRNIHEGALARSQVHGGDLLIKITGVGRMGVASVAPDGFEGNINQHVVVVKTESREIAEYLCDYLNLDVIETIAKRHSTGGVRPALDYTSLRNIPIVEGIDFTRLRDSKKSIKIAEARCLELEASLQAFLEDLLVVKNKKSNGDLYYVQSFYEMIGNSWTPNNFKRHGLKQNETDSFSLIDICSLNKGQSVTSKDVINGDFEVIAGGKTSPYSSETYNTDAGAITISASGAYAGYVWFHDKPIFASDCIVIRSKDESSFLTRYVSEVLKAYQQQLYSLQRGAGQPHVYISDISNFQIPYMANGKQQEIIDEIDRRRVEMKNIRDEAYLKYEEACEEINKYLLS